jgi:alkanesulfonate monooxygenase SsuD/methylene tetrahydromethanopterin reductase-like flavin-dependent oxidoreductase (luciferase family)
MAEYIKKVREAAVSFGRDPYDVKIFVAIMPFLGTTMEEAQAKYDKAQSLLSVQSNLAKLSGSTGVDLSKYPLKEPFKFSGPDSRDGAIIGSIQNMTLLQKKLLSQLPRRCLQRLSSGLTQLVLLTWSRTYSKTGWRRPTVTDLILFVSTSF